MACGGRSVTYMSDSLAVSLCFITMDIVLHIIPATFMVMKLVWNHVTVEHSRSTELINSSSYTFFLLLTPLIIFPPNNKIVYI